jgi:hypothetical protein
MGCYDADNNNCGEGNPDCSCKPSPL